MPYEADFLKPLKSPPRPKKLAGLAVVGTSAADGFVGASLYYDGRARLFDRRDKLLAALAAHEMRGRYVYARDLERALAIITGGDLHWLACTFTDGRILAGRAKDTKDHRFTYLDTLRLFPGASVADLGELAGLAPCDLSEESAWLLESGIAGANTRPLDMAEVWAYCDREAEIICKAVDSFQTLLNQLGGELGLTVASCAMDLYRRRYLDAWLETPAAGWNQLDRLALYGGRCEAWNVGSVADCQGYDVNSLYPAVMAAADFPDPKHMTFAGVHDFRPSMLDREGIAHCTVHVPDMAAPPLPVHTAKGLFFPVGDLAGTWTHCELRRALEVGCKLGKVEWSHYATRTFNPFAAYVKDLYALRADLAEGDVLRNRAYKLLLNSLHGRFALNPEKGLTVLQPLVPPVDWSKVEGSDLRLICDWPYALVPLTGRPQPAYVNTLLAACITARARVRLHELMTGVEEGLSYVDTDSLYGRLWLPEGEGLGDLRGLWEGATLAVKGSKQYVVYVNGRPVKAVAAGVEESLQLAYVESGSATVRRQVGILESARTGRPMAAARHETHTARVQFPRRAPDGKGWGPDDFTLTRPWSMAELAERGAPATS
jgi:hypothetical protein